MGCVEKHDKMKAWHIKIGMDYKGMLEQIVRNYGICIQREKMKLSFGCSQ